MTGASGTVTVSNSGVLTQTGVMATGQNTIGAGGNISGVAAFGASGAFNVITGGVATLANNLVVGSQGNSGSVLVGGTASRLSLEAQLFVGSGSTNPNGAGSLTEQGGGAVTLTAAADTSKYYLSVGNAVNTSGTVLVTGTGPTLDAGGNGVTVGSLGTGTLTVSAGAVARSSSSNSLVNAALAAGRGAGSAGIVTVTGTGSSYTASGYVFSGGPGRGRCWWTRAVFSLAGRPRGVQPWRRPSRSVMARLCWMRTAF